MRHVRLTGWLCAIAVLAAPTGCQRPTMDGYQNSARSNSARPKMKPIDPPAIPDDAPEFTETESGLKYRILRESDGKKPTVRDRVVAHYRGWLDDGKEFDSSYKRGEPYPFSLRGVIPGWTEGLQLVGEGGMIELEIPSDLGYMEQGAPPDIPPNARLHFLIELVKIQ